MVYTRLREILEGRILLHDRFCAKISVVLKKKKKKKTMVELKVYNVSLAREIR